MSQKPSTSLNLLEHLDTKTRLASSVPWWGKTLIGFVFVAVIGGGVFTFSLFSRVSKALADATGGEEQGLWQQIQQLSVPPDKLLQGEADDRVNIVLLGIGGEGHEGSLLADTIIVASIEPSSGRAALFSIPRDFVVEIPGYGFRKINNANAFGDLNGAPGDGARLTSDVLAKLLQAPMQYVVRVDFRGFEQLIDDLGGVSVNVETAFSDREYPTENFGYQTIQFAAGRQTFDGATALKFVRSRHGTNGEGSDFARSRRQQKVLLATKEKVFSLETLLSPSRISDALTTLGAHIETNFEPWELLKLGRMGRTIDVAKVTTRSLDTTPEGLLISADGLDGAFILEPRTGNYSEIRQAFASLLRVETAELARIEIQNGTTSPGLAARLASSLASPTITVVRYGNAGERNHERTILYDLTNGKKPDTLRRLKELLDADVALSLTGLAGASTNLELSDIGSSLTNGSTLKELENDARFADIDFVIVAGSDQIETTDRTNSSS